MNNYKFTGQEKCAVTRILHADCLDVLKNNPDNSVDALVTDPPAGISFMGKAWDGDRGGRDQWVAWLTEAMKECLRVMKPGAHGLVWTLPRTSHWTATALENAGFEVRDVMMHLFGTGFPKSLDVSKAIDKAAGAERKNLGPDPRQTGRKKNSGQIAGTQGTYGETQEPRIADLTAPATDAAKTWSGWGTALKPAAEHWILIRKPISEKTVAANVLKWGTGALNIDASRIEGKPRTTHAAGNFSSAGKRDATMFNMGDTFKCPEPAGRFPSHLILDEEAARLLDEQSGTSKSSPDSRNEIRKDGNTYGKSLTRTPNNLSDSGGASRFFYVAKASKADKGAGNVHPTVKSTTLMEYLCRLITPPGGTILDPFAGSGSTGVAALRAGFEFTGIESEAEYVEIARARVSSAVGNGVVLDTKDTK